jgi:hypothetical protein
MAITRRLLLFFLVSSLALSALFAVAQSVIATVTAGTTPVAVAVFLSTLPTLRPAPALLPPLGIFDSFD